MQNIPIKFREIFWPAAVKMKTGIFTQKKICPQKKSNSANWGMESPFVNHEMMNVSFEPLSLTGNVIFLGEQHGYNIPEVTSAPNVSNWLTEEGVKHIKNCHDDKMLPDHAKRLICDGYMCFYQSPQDMMYQ